MDGAIDNGDLRPFETQRGQQRRFQRRIPSNATGPARPPLLQHMKIKKEILFSCLFFKNPKENLQIRNPVIFS
jgi:hypothetical protein